MLIETDYTKDPMVLFKILPYIKKLNIKDKIQASKIGKTLEEDF